MRAAHTTPHNTCRAQVSDNSTMSSYWHIPSEWQNTTHCDNDYNTGTVGPLRVYAQQTTNTATYTLMIPLISCESRMREKSGLVSVKLKKWCLHKERRRKVFQFTHTCTHRLHDASLPRRPSVSCSKEWVASGRASLLTVASCSS